MSNDKKVETPKVEEKKAEPTLSEAVAAAVRETVTQVIPLAITASQAAARGVAADAAAAKAGNLGDRCQECRQPVKGCQGKHIQMVVYPKNARLADWFPGIKINGVTYRSSHGSQLVTVPESNDIAKMIEAFEESEDNFVNGRTAMHNSGSLGPNGGQTNPAYVPNWR